MGNLGKAILYIAAMTFLSGVVAGKTERLRSVSGLEGRTSQSVSSTSPREYESTLRQDLKRHEGVRYTSYDDSKGIRTVGAGFNLERADARGVIENLGANYGDVFSGRQRLTEAQVDNLLDINITEARGVARRYLGKAYDGLKPEAQDIITNMAFMGEGSLNGFKKLKAALIKKDYLAASEEMKDSIWCSDVKSRGKELVRRMRALAD